MRGVPYEEQTRIIEHIWKAMPRQAGGAFDATGAGHVVAEAMSRRYGKYDPKEEAGGSIAEIKLSVDWYRLHMPRLKAAFEDGTILLPRDQFLLSDLRLVKLVRGVAQVPETRTGEAGAKRHGDFAIALALAWYATLMNVAEYDYESVGGPAAARRDDFNTPPSERDFSGSGRWREPKGHDVRGAL
jgi:phage FluMu gp28-like protein